MHNMEQIHPLFNNLVLTGIMSHLEHNHLRTFRSVCKFWFQISLDRWRSTSVVQLVEDSKALEDVVQLYETKDDLLSLQRNPIATYEISWWGFDRNSDEIDPDRLESFRLYIAPTVECLVIDFCRYPSQKFEAIVLNCKNLKELRLSKLQNDPSDTFSDPLESIPTHLLLCKLKRVNVSDHVPFRWKWLMMHAPNVEDVVIRKNFTYMNENLDVFIRDQQDLQATGGSLWNLSSLDTMYVDWSFQSDELARLATLNFPRLKILSIQMERANEEIGLAPLLRRHHKTLEILKLCCVSRERDYETDRLEFPYGIQLNKLKELYIFWNVVDNLGFLGMMPNLRMLHLDRENYDKSYLRMCLGEESESEAVVEDLMIGVESSNEFLMKDLEKLYVDCRFSEESLKRLKSIMPNLKDISTVLCNGTVKVLCRLWPELTRLSMLCGSTVDDNGIIGPDGVSRLKFVQADKN